MAAGGSPPMKVWPGTCFPMCSSAILGLWGIAGFRGVVCEVRAGDISKTSYEYTIWGWKRCRFNCFWDVACSCLADYTSKTGNSPQTEKRGQSPLHIRRRVWRGSTASQLGNDGSIELMLPSWPKRYLPLLLSITWALTTPLQFFFCRKNIP